MWRDHSGWLIYVSSTWCAFALMHFCVNMLGRSMGHISFYPQAIRTNHLSRLLRCKGAFKEPCLFLRPLAVCATPQARRVWTTSIFFDFQAFSGRNRNRQSMLHHSSSREICGLRLSWHRSHRPRRVAAFTTLFRAGPPVSVTPIFLRTLWRKLSASIIHQGTIGTCNVLDKSK